GHGSADFGCVVQAPATGEYGEAPKQLLSLTLQQVVTPCHRVADRAGAKVGRAGRRPKTPVDSRAAALLQSAEDASLWRLPAQSPKAGRRACDRYQAPATHSADPVGDPASQPARAPRKAS